MQAQRATGTGETTQFSVEALQEWESHVEDVLRGVAHALNNRAASVSAVLELSMEADRSESATRALLASEVQRLHELVDVVKSVGTPRSGAEAFDARDAVAVAKHIMSVHAGLRDRSVAIDAPAVLAVRTHKWMFVRALVALAARGVRGGSGGTGLATIQVREDGDSVEVRASGTAAGGAVGRSRYADELARAMGGAPLSDAPGFRIPTLVELRRREGR